MTLRDTRCGSCNENHTKEVVTDSLRARPYSYSRRQRPGEGGTELVRFAGVVVVETRGSGDVLPARAQLRVICLWNTQEHQARPVCGPAQNLKGMSDQWR